MTRPRDLPQRPQRIEVHIDSLVIEGYDVADGPGLRAAVATQVARQLAQKQLSGSLAGQVGAEVARQIDPGHPGHSGRKK